MKFMKKAAAIACGAAIVSAVSIAAISASAEGTNVIKAAQVYAEPGQVVEYAVNLEGNTGFEIVNYTLVYDSKLKPVVTKEDNRTVPKNKSDEYSGMVSLFINQEDYLIGYGMTAMSKQLGDKALAYFYFEVPENAEDGDTYPISFLTENTELIVGDVNQTVSSEAGWIKVKTAGTSDVTTEANTEATAEETTSETTEETTAETTAETTESSDVVTEESTVSTDATVSSDSTDNGEGTTTTSATNAATVSTNAGGTTKQGGNGGSTTNGGKQDGPSAGDAGVAMAVAGLLAAAGSAVVCRKKH